MATALDSGFVPITFKKLGGGLNTTSGPLGVDDTESTELKNIDFDKFGSALKRNGYAATSSSPTASGTAQGLYWYTSLFDRQGIMVNDGKIYKVNIDNGVQTDITGAISFSSGGAIDSDVKLLLQMDGADESDTIGDSSPSSKTVVNTESYDDLTVLMLHCDGTDGSTTFTDSSLGTHTVTAVNSAQLSTAVKKFGTASGLFASATSDNLTSSDSNDWFFSTTDFTVDFFVRFNSVAGDQAFMGQYIDANNRWALLKDGDQKLSIDFKYGGTAKGNYLMTNAWSVSTDTWYHIAFVRIGASAKIFIDGVSQTLTENTAFGTNDVGNLASDLTICQEGNNVQYVDGYMDEIRVSNGISRWQTDFTAPTAPYGKVYNTRSVTKLGEGTGEFKGYERLSVADSTDWEYGSDPFTIDFWVNFNNLTATHNNYVTFYQQEVDSDNKVNLWLNSGNNLFFEVISGSTTMADYSCSWAPVTSSWVHVAVVRSDTDFFMFIDGTAQTVTSRTPFSTNSVPDLATSIYIGADAVNSQYFLTGWLDEYRISTAARWVADFTPPTSPYGEFKQQDFETFLGYVMGGDSENIPWQFLSGNTTATNMTVISGLTGAAFIKRFQNYLIMANVRVNGIRYPSRFYWSSIRTIDTWNDADWIEVEKDDGDEITGLRVLGDRLVVYKNTSIYVVLFTGDSDLPFIYQKSNSPVGCTAPFSIQEVDNGHVFMSQDGIYFFDGYNAFKMSDRISNTFTGLNDEKFDKATSLYYRKKNLYMVSIPSNTSLLNEYVLTWNSFLNAWSVYTGMSASAMATFMINGTEERPYFADYSGYIYRMDTGSDDFPENSRTAIDAEYYTNWKYYDTICVRKGIPHIYLVHRNESSTVLNLNYAYDFYNGDQYTQSFSLFTTRTVTALTTRRDLKDRGRFVRIGFSNSQTSTSFSIDGIGTYITRESKT